MSGKDRSAENTERIGNGAAQCMTGDHDANEFAMLLDFKGRNTEMRDLNPQDLGSGSQSDDSVER